MPPVRVCVGEVKGRSVRMGRETRNQVRAQARGEGEEMSDKEFATELEFLKWYYQQADFGPAHEDVLIGLKELFEERTGKLVPKGYRYGIDESES